jgi:prepilin-type N-terminal cleavage/methylation domain-containing protein/prepilin-type processing-associated H-X9-DG protein
MAQNRLRRGFTLVELLVVIGIIALLISILMPALSAAKHQANLLKCASNLRTLGQVMQQYAADNKGNIPRDYTKSEIRQGHILWAEAFAPYLDKKFVQVRDLSDGRDAALVPQFAKIKVYQCPVFPVAAQSLDYVVNGWDKDLPGGGTQAAFKVTKFKRSSQIVFMTEAHSNRQVNDYHFHDVWLPSHLPNGSEPRILRDNRHRGLLNVVYLDGHVGARAFKTLKDADFRLFGE